MVQTPLTAEQIERNIREMRGDVLCSGECGVFDPQEAPTLPPLPETVQVTLEVPITAATINAALQVAKAYLLLHPADTYIVKLPAGTHTITDGTLNLTNVGYPAMTGRAVLRGSGINQTFLVTDPLKAAYVGRPAYHTTISDLTFTITEQPTTQGIVVSVAPGEVVLDIQTGFPNPPDIYNDAFQTCYLIDEDTYKTRCEPPRQYLLRFDNAGAFPRLIDTWEFNISWLTTELVSAGRYKFILEKTDLDVGERLGWGVGDLIAVKSKWEFGRMYDFTGGYDIVHERVAWDKWTRGIFHSGCHHVRISNCEVRRTAAISGQVPAFTSNGGGPQIIGTNSLRTHHNIVEDCIFQNLADDPINMTWNSGSSIIRRCMMSDVIRGIVLVNSPNVILQGNTLIRAELVYIP